MESYPKQDRLPAISSACQSGTNNEPPASSFGILHTQVNCRRKLNPQEESPLVERNCLSNMPLWGVRSLEVRQTLQEILPQPHVRRSKVAVKDDNKNHRDSVSSMEGDKVFLSSRTSGGSPVFSITLQPSLLYICNAARFSSKTLIQISSVLKSLIQMRSHLSTFQIFKPIISRR